MALLWVDSTSESVINFLDADFDGVVSKSSVMKSSHLPPSVGNGSWSSLLWVVSSSRIENFEFFFVLPMILTSPGLINPD